MEDKPSNSDLVQQIDLQYLINQDQQKRLTGKFNETPIVANYYRKNNISSIIVGEENYGEGSSREHAAMEPRFVGVKVVLVKSFARIHETNLKKQGILALTFIEKNDYDKIFEDDVFNILGLKDFRENKKKSDPKGVRKNHKDYDTIIHYIDYNRKKKSRLFDIFGTIFFFDNTVVFHFHIWIK